MNLNSMLLAEALLIWKPKYEQRHGKKHMHDEQKRRTVAFFWKCLVDRLDAANGKRNIESNLLSISFPNQFTSNQTKYVASIATTYFCTYLYSIVRVKHTPRFLTCVFYFSNGIYVTVDGDV